MLMENSLPFCFYVKFFSSMKRDDLERLLNRVDHDPTLELERGFVRCILPLLKIDRERERE